MHELNSSFLCLTLIRIVQGWGCWTHKIEQDGIHGGGGGGGNTAISLHALVSCTSLRIFNSGGRAGKGG